MTSDAQRRRESRERYETLLSVVAHQTSPTQPPGVRPVHTRVTMCSHNGHDPDAVDSAIRAALENDDLLRWRDADGEIRLTLRTEPDLKRLAEHVAEELQDPDQLARVNTALLEVRNDE
jgi:hypothetical protein